MAATAVPVRPASLSLLQCVLGCVRLSEGERGSVCLWEADLFLIMCATGKCALALQGALHRGHTRKTGALERRTGHDKTIGTRPCGFTALSRCRVSRAWNKAAMLRINTGTVGPRPGHRVLLINTILGIVRSLPLVAIARHLPTVKPHPSSTPNRTTRFNTSPPISSTPHPVKKTTARHLPRVEQLEGSAVGSRLEAVGR